MLELEIGLGALDRLRGVGGGWRGCEMYMPKGHKRYKYS